MTPAKKTKGRQKIEMTKILDEKSLAVTFSKRHSGLFSKANELSTLCGVELAIIMFSPTKKPISYGVPSVEAILDRYMEQLPPPDPRMSQYMESYRNASIQQLNSELTDMIAQTQAEKKTGEELDLIKKDRQDRHWWNAPIETLDAEQLEKLKAAMLELRNSAEKQAERLMVEAATTSTPIIPGFRSMGADGAGPSN
ncbi:agamous-like MADS-box protein AGL62 [Cynara cardunculus var. scolymus]|uniref:Transcription factor, MADS-box n=1 Tax=Cynara cardunculus var. scolymus TaxID=59895 RepID=A0A124SHJ1_CYNCS|nr:agamous-like MADS-box protein AGL62 [Cynara cardunculus var. scolymus]KVI09692.1 Transcription factor, MADS-box [Cynara cardunculus var. scolymus]